MDISDLSVDGTPSPAKRKTKPTALFTSPNSGFDLGSPKEIELSTSLSNLKWGFKRREEGLLEQLAIHKEALAELYKLHINLKDKLNAAGTTTCEHLEMMEEVVELHAEYDQQYQAQIQHHRVLQNKLNSLESDKVKLEASNEALQVQLRLLQLQYTEQKSQASVISAAGVDPADTAMSVLPISTNSEDSGIATGPPPPPTDAALAFVKDSGTSECIDVNNTSVNNSIGGEVIYNDTSASIPSTPLPDTPSKLSVKDRLRARVAKNKDSAGASTSSGAVSSDSANSTTSSGGVSGGIAMMGDATSTVSVVDTAPTTTSTSIDRVVTMSPLRNTTKPTPRATTNRRHSAEAALPSIHDTTSFNTTSTSINSITTTSNSRRNSYPRKSVVPKQDTTKNPVKKFLRAGSNKASSLHKDGHNTTKSPRTNSADTDTDTNDNTIDTSTTSNTTSTTTKTNSPRISLRKRIELHQLRSRDHNLNHNAWVGAFSTAGRTSGGGMQFFVDIVEPKSKNKNSSSGGSSSDGSVYGESGVVSNTSNTRTVNSVGSGDDGDVALLDMNTEDVVELKNSNIEGEEKDVVHSLDYNDIYEYSNTIESIESGSDMVHGHISDVVEYKQLTLQSPSHSMHSIHSTTTHTTSTLAEVQTLRTELNSAEEEVSILYSPVVAEVEAAPTSGVLDGVTVVEDTVNSDVNGSGSSDTVMSSDEIVVSVPIPVDTTAPIHTTIPSIDTTLLPTLQTTSTDTPLHNAHNVHNTHTTDTSTTHTPNSPNKFLMSEVQSYKKQVQVLKTQLAALLSEIKPSVVTKPSASVGVQCTEASLFVVDISPHSDSSNKGSGAVGSSSGSVADNGVSSTANNGSAVDTTPTLFQLAAETPVKVLHRTIDSSVDSSVGVGGSVVDSGSVEYSGSIVDIAAVPIDTLHTIPTLITNSSTSVPEETEIDDIFVELVDSSVQCTPIECIDNATNTDAEYNTVLSNEGGSSVVCEIGVQCDSVGSGASVSRGVSPIVFPGASSSVNSPAAHSNSFINDTTLPTTTIPLATASTTTSIPNPVATTTTTTTPHDRALIQAIEDSKFELGRKLFELKFADMKREVRKGSGRSSKGSGSDKGSGKGKHVNGSTTARGVNSNVDHTAHVTPTILPNTNSDTNSKALTTSNTTVNATINTTNLPSTTNDTTTDTSITDHAELLKLNTELVTRLLHKNTLHVRNQQKIGMLTQKLCRLVMFVKSSGKSGASSNGSSSNAITSNTQHNNVNVLRSATTTIPTINTTNATSTTNAINTTTIRHPAQHTPQQNESLRVGDISFATDLTQLLCIDTTSDDESSSEPSPSTITPVLVQHADDLFSSDVNTDTNTTQQATIPTTTHPTANTTARTSRTLQFVDGPTDLFSPQRDFQGRDYNEVSELNITVRSNPLLHNSGVYDTTHNNGSSGDNNMSSIMDISFGDTSGLDVPNMESVSNNKDLFSPIQKSSGNYESSSTKYTNSDSVDSTSNAVTKAVESSVAKSSIGGTNTSSGSNYNLNSLYARNPLMVRTNSRTTMRVLQPNNSDTSGSIGSKGDTVSSVSSMSKMQSVRSVSKPQIVDTTPVMSDVPAVYGSSDSMRGSSDSISATFTNPLRSMRAKTTSNSNNNTNNSSNAISTTTTISSETNTTPLTSTLVLTDTPTTTTLTNATSPDRLNSALSNSVRSISAFQARTSPNKITLREPVVSVEPIEPEYTQAGVDQQQDSGHNNTRSDAPYHTTLQSEDLHRQLLQSEGKLHKLQQHADYLEGRNKNLLREKELLLAKLSHTLHNDAPLSQGVRIYTPLEEYALDSPSATTSIVLGFIENNNVLLDKIGALTSALEDKMRQVAKQSQAEAELNADLSKALAQNHHLSAEVSDLMSVNRTLTTENEAYQRQVSQLTGTLVHMAQENKLLKERMRMYSF